MVQHNSQMKSISFIFEVINLLLIYAEIEVYLWKICRRKYFITGSITGMVLADIFSSTARVHHGRVLVLGMGSECNC